MSSKTKYKRHGPLHADCHYLRLDFDLENLGPLLKEAQPHVHSRPAREPRLNAPLGSGGNVVVDFIEFIFKTYRHAEWHAWAKGDLGQAGT